MKILVTGAKGFAGKNLCAQLNNIKEGKARNYGVTVDEYLQRQDPSEFCTNLHKFVQLNAKLLRINQQSVVNVDI